MTHLTIGDPAPWFSAPTDVNQNFNFATVAGRHVVVNFLGRLDREGTEKVAKDWGEAGGFLNTNNEVVFHVISDPRDQAQARFKQHPGVIAFWDEDETVAKLFGVRRKTEDGAESYHPCTIVLDQNLRVLGVVPIQEPSEHAGRIYQYLRGLPAAPGVGALPARGGATALRKPRFRREPRGSRLRLYARCRRQDRRAAGP